MRTLIEKDPFLNPAIKARVNQPRWHTGRWPSHWINHPTDKSPPFVVVYKRTFNLDEEAIIRMHITADERYALYLDGAKIGRGPERGDRWNWFFETHDLQLDAGEHTLVALVWALGEQAPLAQISIQPGFLLACEAPEWNAQVGTGVAAWHVKLLNGLNFFKDGPGFGTGASVCIEGQDFDWGFECGEGDGWVTAEIGSPGYSAWSYSQHGEAGKDHQLKPAPLPAMLEKAWPEGTIRRVENLAAPTGASDEEMPTSTVAYRAENDLTQEHAAWRAMVHDGQTLTLAPHTRRRVLIDLEDYVCGYVHLVTRDGAGANVTIKWAESLYETPIEGRWDPHHAPKGNRDQVEDKYFFGESDVFKPDGGSQRVFEPLWWKSGRYLEIVVSTEEEALDIERLDILETRYPLESEAMLVCAGEDTKDAHPLMQIWPIMVRALQMCAHETYFDCPHYEQLMYVGDTRLEALVTYCLTRDDRLPRKAIAMFEASRMTNNLTQARYPCRATQFIPPFSLWWCAMVYDYALWRGDPAFIRRMMPGVRGVIDAFLSYRNADGLVEGPPGWNYVDWVPDPHWHRGVPPDGEDGVSSIINWHFALTLTLVARLETWLGEPEAATRALRYAQAIAQAIGGAFWDEERGLFADTVVGPSVGDLGQQHGEDLGQRHGGDLGQRTYAEHAQCLALLSGLLDAEKHQHVAEGLLMAEDLTHTTIYFSHYLFEAYRRIGHTDVGSSTEKFFERLEEWYDLARLGFKTTRESPEPSRSDCHAWGAHPVYHSFASILGIRPAEFGFKKITIHPMLGDLTEVKATLPHPQGFIHVHLKKTAQQRLRGTITLPEGTTGTLIYGECIQTLEAGEQTIKTP
jgi:hypothetical protein